MSKSKLPSKDKTSAPQRASSYMSDTKSFGDSVVDQVEANKGINQGEDLSASSQELEEQELEDLERIGVTREALARGTVARMAEENVADEDFLIEEQPQVEGRELINDELIKEQQRRAEGIAVDVKNLAREQVERGKHWTASNIGQLAQALDHTADELTGSQVDLARYTRKVSNQLNHFSENLDNQDLNQLIDKVEQFTRRQPELVFCGSLLGGLLLSRFLRSNAGRPTQTQTF